MCGGGGGGGTSAETRALQNQQLKQAQQDEQRRTIEEQRRLNAVQQINALYGMQSKAADVDAYNKALGSMYDLENPGGLEKDKYLTDNALKQVSNAEVSTNEAQRNAGGRDKYLADNALKQVSVADVMSNEAQRNAGYDKVRQSNLGLMMSDIARNRADTTRNVGFGLQRNGLFGGSVDVDTHRDITDANQRSVIQANQLADSQVASMRSNDESTRADLISRINAGLDADSAAATASQRMAINRQQALSEPSSGALNNLFASIGGALNSYQYANGAANPYGNMGKQPGGNMGGYGGRVTY